MLPLLIATLEGEVDVHDVDSVYPLGRSFLGRMKRKAGNVASSQVRNVGHGVARIGRATGKVAMDVKRGNFQSAFVDLGRAVTTTVSTPLTMAVGVVDRKAASKVEGVIARNDPAALLNRKIFEALKAAVRPIVRKFSGDDLDGFGDESAVRSTLRAQRAKIVAASVPVGTAIGAKLGGPYGAPIGAGLAPAAVDAVIEEAIAKARSAAAGSSATAAAAEPVTEGNTATGSKIPTVVKIAAAGVGVYLLSKVLR